MLARAAESLYWVGRELERGMAVARLLEVGHATALEGALSNGAGPSAVWEPMLEIVGCTERFRERYTASVEHEVVVFLTLETTNPDGVLPCLSRARDRAGDVRNRLPTEVFEAICAAHIAAATWTPERLSHEGVYAFCDEVRDTIARADGAASRGMRRDEHWHFLQMGRAVERAIQTARLIGQHRTVRSGQSIPGGFGDRRVVLRAASAYEAYLRVATPSDPVEDFLLRDRGLPSSVAFCLTQARVAADSLRDSGVTIGNLAARAALATAGRALIAATQLGSDGPAMETLAVRLEDLHDVLASLFFTTPKDDDDSAYTQAIRQAQN